MGVILGLDLSLTSTGLAVVKDGQVWDTANVKSTGKKGATYDDWMSRIENVHLQIACHIADWLEVDHYDIELAVIEAPSHGSKFGNPHERAGLWWKVYADLREWDIPVQTLAPASRAKFITGNGRADKKQVLEAARARWGMDIANHDIADAVGLAMWGERAA